VTPLEVQPKPKPQGSFFVQVQYLDGSLPARELPPVVPVYDNSVSKDLDRVLNALPLNVTPEIGFLFFR